MAGQRYHPKYSRKSLTPKSEGHRVPVQNGQRKHREFEYPNIERVKITADGAPGAIYNHGIPKDKLFLEATRLFGDRGVTESTFYLGSQLGLVIDLRTTSEKNLFGNGKEMSKKKEISDRHRDQEKTHGKQRNLSCFPGVMFSWCGGGGFGGNFCVNINEQEGGNFSCFDDRDGDRNRENVGESFQVQTSEPGRRYRRILPHS